ncbi:MAG: CHAT domain-containing protein, partial [Thermoanaerobaculia bacterium]|nr:CHAT domain-containing protein [Thermoanaerobaculia bacterium]
LVSYFVTADAAYVFLLRAGAFAAFRLTVSPAELEGRVRNYVDLMMRGDTDAAKRIGRRLHAELVSPWLDGLGPAVRELIFVLDGPLHYLPFETLGDRPMVEDFEISYAPSATVLAGLRKGRDASRPGPLADLFLVANTWSEAAGPATTAAWRSGALSTGQRALPFAAVEAKRIAPYAGKGSEILVGAQASEERIRATALDRFRVLHFATHGLAAGDSLAQSALLLGPGPSGATGYLRATDIYRLKLASDLVVLSACRTAHGRLLGGEGVQSLAQAFLSAGARTVVASLWNVPDESTASFMAAFYEALSRGRTKGQALREAKLEFLRSSRWSAPRHWAPFVLIGDARETIPLPRPSWWRRLVMTASR